MRKMTFYLQRSFITMTLIWIAVISYKLSSIEIIINKNAFIKRFTLVFDFGVGPRQLIIENKISELHKRRKWSNALSIELIEERNIIFF